MKQPLNNAQILAIVEEDKQRLADRIAEFENMVSLSDEQQTELESLRLSLKEINEVKSWKL